VAEQTVIKYSAFYTGHKNKSAGDFTGHNDLSSTNSVLRLLHNSSHSTALNPPSPPTPPPPPPSPRYHTEITFICFENLYDLRQQEGIGNKLADNLFYI